MTRINCIPVQALTREHLVAEYREMLRLRNLHPRQTLPAVSTYRLGKGHVLFFADKGRWLMERHGRLRDEMRRRGYTVNYQLDLSAWPDEAMGDWEPGVDDKLLNIGRVLRRVKER